VIGEPKERLAANPAKAGPARPGKGSLDRLFDDLGIARVLPGDRKASALIAISRLSELTGFICSTRGSVRPSTFEVNRAPDRPTGRMTWLASIFISRCSVSHRQIGRSGHPPRPSLTSQRHRRGGAGGGEHTLVLPLTIHGASI
jgi:hypothetical protein